MSKLSRLVHNFFSEKKLMTLEEARSYAQSGDAFPRHIVLVDDSSTTPGEMHVSNMNFGHDTVVEYNGPEFHASAIIAKQIIHTNPRRNTPSRHRIMRSRVQQDIVNNVEHVVFENLQQPAEIYLNNVRALKLLRNLKRPKVNIGNRFSLEDLQHDDPEVSRKLCHICPNLSARAV